MKSDKNNILVPGGY